MDTNLIIIFVVGIVLGIGAEFAARKRPNIRLLGAVVLALIGAALGDTLVNDITTFSVGLAIAGAVIGALVLMIPWTVLRGGYGPYGRKRTWRRRFEK